MKLFYSKIRLTCPILIFLILILFVNCNCSKSETTIYGQKGTTKFFSFFKKGLIHKIGDTVYAEVSGVTFDGTNLIFANEDPYPFKDNSLKKLSPIFEMKYKKFTKLNEESYDPIIQFKVRKFEDLTMLTDPSGKEYVVATTAFDRKKDRFYKYDSYNTLLYWPKEDLKNVKMVDPTTEDSIMGSWNIRRKLLEVLELTEDKYFKVEGLAAIPNNKLLFGIRAVGADYKNNYYTIKIISADYTIDHGKLTLSNFQNTFEHYIKTYIKKTGYNVVGLSSLEYDKFNNRLYMLTSFEKCDSTYEAIGAYLWVLTVDKSSLISKPKLVFDKKTSKPLVFNHKAEGIAVISPSELFVVHDDDEIIKYIKPINGTVPDNREPHESGYTIVKIEN